MRFFIFISLLFLCSLAFGQQKIEGTLSGYLHQNLILLDFFGDKHTFVDSTRTDGNGWFKFEMDEDAPSGIYSLAIGKTPLFNFIYNQDVVTLKYDPANNNLPEFIFSIENLIYFDYLVRSDKYLYKKEMLQDILLKYPDNDSFYAYSETYFFDIQDEFRAYTDRILQEYPQTFVSRIIKSDRPVMLPQGFNWESFFIFNQSHFLDEIDFTDTSLLYTDVFTGKAINYLGFYTLNNGNKVMQEKLFSQAVDTILYKAMDNGKVYDFLIQYLMEGFDMYGFDNVITHIAENYEPSNTCVNEERKTELQKRMEHVREMAVGKTAPDIIIENKDGSKLRLADIDSDYTLILFWASWCPHCSDMIPVVEQMYSSADLPDFEVLAISIDTSATAYSSALARHATPWINYSELKGWNSKTAVDYSIYATPTMFLLDRNRKIIARPVTTAELHSALIKLENN